MKASFGKKIAVFCLSAVMAVGIGFGISGIEAAQAHTAEKDIVLDSYKLDSVVTVSDDTQASGTVFPKTVQISETEIASAYVVTYPNGITLSVKDGIVLDQLGLYTITYKSVVGGVANIYSDTFKVHNNFSNDSSLIEAYEKNVYSGYKKLSVKNEYGIYDTNNPLDDATVRKVLKGVRANLAPGTVVEFNNIINVNNVRNDGFCEIAFFNPNAVNRIDKKLNFGYIDLTITDVNDPNNYITFTAACQVGSVGYTFGASTKYLPLTATRDSYIDGVTEIPGTRKIIYIDGVKTAVYLNKTDTWGNGEQALYDYKFLYNPVTHEIKRECVRHFDFEDGSIDDINTDFVVDLDNPEIYDGDVKLFEGFSTGEVKLSVEARNFNASSGYCEFYSIGDVANEELQEYYTNDLVDDNKAPEIKVDVKQTDSNGVYTAFNPTNPVKFKIPSAIVYDANECLAVSTRVYKNYTDASKIFVQTNPDGTFDVTEKVIYTIEYKVSDVFGNVSYTTLTVLPVSTTELVEGDVQFNQGIQAVFDKITLNAGKEYNGEILKYLNTNNLNSELKVKVSVLNGEEVMFAGEYGYEDFAGENKPLFSVKPLTVGTYTVNYEISDNAETINYSYNVDCVSVGFVNFPGDPLVLDYYILGMTYEKPDFTAYKFADSMIENPTDAYFSYDEGATWTKIEKYTYKVGVDANGAIMPNVKTIKFKFVSEGVTDYISKSAPVIDVRTDDSIANNDPVRVKQEKVSGVTYAGNIDQVKYFVGENAVISKSASNTVIINPTVNSGNAVARFINPVSIDETGSFYFEFSTDKIKIDFNSVTIRYIDAYDHTNVATAKFFDKNGATRLSINGAKEVTAGIELHGGTFQTYYSLTNEVFMYGTKKFDMEFTPTNKLFYIELEIGDINGDNVQATVTTIANHKFQLARTVDGSAPLIYIDSAAGSYSINTEVVIKAPSVVDVLTPYVKTLDNGTNRTKITVMKNKQYVKSVDNITLDGTQDPARDYVLKLSEYASWDVKYDVYDEAGKSKSLTYTISAIDTVAPAIELNYGFNEDTIHNVTLGKMFSIEYSITDNITEATKLQTYVMIYRDSDYFNVYNSEPFEILADRSTWSNISDSCILTRKGLYTVHIFAMDEDFNMSYASYKVNVQ